MEPTSYSDPKTLGSLQHLKLSTQMVLDSLKKGQHLNPRAGYSIEFSQHREYAAGDDLRHLDWKAYARTDRLYVKQFQDETSLCCYLAVDNSLSMSFQGPTVSSSKYHHAALLASCISRLVVQQGDAVGLSLLGGESSRSLLPSDQTSQWSRAVQFLEQGQPKKSDGDWMVGLSSLGFEMGNRGVIFLIGDWLDELAGLGEILQRFRESLHLDVRVVHILDPEELEPTLQGRVQLEDLERGDRLRINADRIRQAYLQEMEDYLRDFRAICHRFGARYELLKTDDTIANVLPRLLAAEGS